MSKSRKASLIFGSFFAGTFIFSIPALFFYDQLFHDASYILGGRFDTTISIGALLEILLAICNIATAVVLFPIAKRASEPAALGYVASRTIESGLILSGVVSLMAIVTLRTTFVPGGDTVALTTAGRGLLAFHDWTFLLGPQFCSGFGNGMLLGYLMYRSGLVPKRMALLGLIGGPLAFIGGVLVLFDIIKPMSPELFVLTALEIVWELSVTIYPLVKGFRACPALDAFDQTPALTAN
jgi:hypothetical protein